MPLPKGLITGKTSLEGVRSLKTAMGGGMPAYESALYPGLRIILPLPPSGLQANARVHFMKRASLTKESREAAFWAAREAIAVQGWVTVERATVRTVFFFKDKRRRDEGNLRSWCKAAEDGLQDAGVVVNDSGFTFHPPEVYCSKEHPRVEFYVKEVA